MSNDECQSCQNMAYTIDYLERKIDELNRDLSREYKKTHTAEAKVETLKPYKERADRSYDLYITDPYRGASDEEDDEN